MQDPDQIVRHEVAQLMQPPQKRPDLLVPPAGLLQPLQKNLLRGQQD